MKSLALALMITAVATQAQSSNPYVGDCQSSKQLLERTVEKMMDIHKDVLVVCRRNLQSPECQQRLGAHRPGIRQISMEFMMSTKVLAEKSCEIEIIAYGST